MLINTCYAYEDWVIIFNRIKHKNIIIQNDDAMETCDIIIPLTIKMAKKYNEQIIGKVFCPNNETLDLLGDKINFQRFMMKNYRINIPKTRYHYPYIAKHRNGNGGNDVNYIRNVEDFSKYKIGDDHVKQEYIHSDNYHVGQYIIKNGIILKKYFYMVNIDPSKINIAKGKLLEYNKVTLENDEIFVELFKYLNYTGFACANFTIVDNVIKIFEINPRIGGTFISNIEDLFDGLNTLLFN